jgi:hypothetical protein
MTFDPVISDHHWNTVFQIFDCSDDIIVGLESVIGEVLQQRKDHNMDLEVEDNVAGFLGVHIERNEAKGEITLTQKA